MKKWIFVLLASTTFAALPPLAQGIRELQAMLSDQRFYNALGSAEMIKDIIRTEKGFLVLTQHYALQVDVKYGGGDKRVMGPVHFELEFYPPIDVTNGMIKTALD